MKTLYLLRHAKSSWKDASLSDFDRPLNKRGKHDAPMMAEKLKEMGIHPDIILSSPARRARKTAKVFADILDTPLRLDERLYEADVADFDAVTQEAFREHESITLVSHNPGLNMYNDALSNVPLFNIPTTGIVAIDFETYDAFVKHEGRQRFFIYPKMYKA